MHAMCGVCGCYPLWDRCVECQGTGLHALDGTSTLTSMPTMRALTGTVQGPVSRWTLYTDVPLASLVSKLDGAGCMCVCVCVCVCVSYILTTLPRLLA